VSTGQVYHGSPTRVDAFETRDFYLACFLRCAGYDLIDLRTEGRRKVFIFRDRPTRRDDVLTFYRDGVTVSPLAFSTTYVERPCGQGHLQTFPPGGTVRSYVRPFWRGLGPLASMKSAVRGANQSNALVAHSRAGLSRLGISSRGASSACCTSPSGRH
jgi:Domain of unknown function (DUF5659)